MKILFAMSSPEYLRFYDDAIRELASRGHDVMLAVAVVRDGKPVRLDAIQQASSRISFAGLVPARGDRWTGVARAVRGTMDFVRYLHPDLASAVALRARVKRQALPWALQWIDGVTSLPLRWWRRVMNVLAAFERAVPGCGTLVRFLDQHAPDLVLVTPLVEPASDQVDLVKAARARGIRVGTLVASWDNLTNKGDLRVTTGFVAVWNEAQKREAVEFHRVAPEHVVVTGAQPFDRWFDRAVSQSREEFCRSVGLPAHKPFVLFTGSSIFIARAEAEMPFVGEWIEALRRSDDPIVREMAVLVRPHPYNGRAWNPDAFAGLADVAVWPRGGYDPVDEQNRAGLFDSLYHSAAVVGINTSAMIEAAIVGRPVLSIEAPQFVGSQDGTLHYRHLLPENGGFLRVASTLDEHVRQLGSVLQNAAGSREELTRFVHRFVRPHGLEAPATPILVDALERYGASPAPAPAATSLMAWSLRVLLLPLTFIDRALLAPSERKRVRSSDRPRVQSRPAAASPVVAPTRLPVAILLALVAPAVAATVLVGAFAVSEMLGATPFSYEPPGNIAEAAGMGLGPEVVRYLRQGQDPTKVLEIRPDIISSDVTRVTALEAAVWSRRVQVVRLLDRENAIHSGVTRLHLACLASELRIDEIVAYLAPNGVDDCDPGLGTRLIEARSQ